MTCSRCGKIIWDQARVYMKCPATFEYFSEGVHRAAPEEPEDIWHTTCDEEDED